MTENKTDKTTYIDFKTLSEKKEQISGLTSTFHSNPLIEKLLKFTHTKLSKSKNKYRPHSNFNPEDLI